MLKLGFRLGAVAVLRPLLDGWVSRIGEVHGVLVAGFEFGPDGDHADFLGGDLNVGVKDGIAGPEGLHAAEPDAIVVLGVVAGQLVERLLARGEEDVDALEALGKIDVVGPPADAAFFPRERADREGLVAGLDGGVEGHVGGRLVDLDHDLDEGGIVGVTQELDSE